MPSTPESEETRAPHTIEEEFPTVEPCTCGPRAEAGPGAEECPRAEECYENWLLTKGKTT